MLLVLVVVVAAVEPSVQLNEIFTVTLTIVNLTGVVVDLILKVRAPNPSIPHLMSNSKCSTNLHPSLVILLLLLRLKGLPRLP